MTTYMLFHKQTLYKEPACRRPKMQSAYTTEERTTKEVFNL